MKSNTSSSEGYLAKQLHASSLEITFGAVHKPHTLSLSLSLSHTHIPQHRHIVFCYLISEFVFIDLKLKPMEQTME